MKKILLFFTLLLLMMTDICAQREDCLWLQPVTAQPVNVCVDGVSPTVSVAIHELKIGWKGKSGAKVNLLLINDKSLKNNGFKIHNDTIAANTDVGLLYGAYALLRSQRTGEDMTHRVFIPSYQLRILNHWDNLDGSVERGYAGRSIFWRSEAPFVITRRDKWLWEQYARANASVGINGTVLNNVNASPLILSAQYLDRVRSIANVLRPYGIRVYLSVNFASPKPLGKLKTADPLNPSVINWWKSKVKKIYELIPDFGGFLVKASSEGQPGPQDYGRTHADGANMLASALRPYGGVVMWRAFVYTSNDNDRAKQAYSEFMPLDGEFRDNVIIQVKNGPIDFQPREPFSPLFCAMTKTSIMPEFQITQEYLGHSVYLVFLAKMWEECLKSDTYQHGKGSTVARCTDGSIYPQSYTAIAGVANVGLDTNWCGNIFAQSNWYAFGRLAWNDTLTSARICDEWLRQTFTPPMRQNKLPADWTAKFLRPVQKMMLESREAAVDFMMPLGLHHIMSANGHYGPGPWWAPKGVRSDWTPPYYHKAAIDGIGFNRTASGSDAVSQYHSPLDSEFSDLATCPEIYLLWFHHLPWDYKMKSGKTLWDEICLHYENGVRQVRDFQRIWKSVRPYVNGHVFEEVAQKLKAQFDNAVLWKDACLLYFQQYSQREIPKGVTAPVHKLDSIIADEFKHRID